jgi:hypothetical protein
MLIVVVLKAVIIKTTVFWDVTPCSLLELTDVSELGLLSDYGDGLDGWSSIPGTGKIYLSLGPTEPPVQWVPGVKRPGLKLTTHLHIMPRSGIVELYLQVPLVRLYSVLLDHLKHRGNFTCKSGPSILRVKAEPARRRQ